MASRAFPTLLQRVGWCALQGGGAHASASHGFRAFTSSSTAAGSSPSPSISTSTPATSAQQGTTASTSVNRQALVNKLLYRSRQRGFLELDLMMGLWAEKEVPRMSEDMLRHFSTVLDLENPDLFKWLTGQLPTPDDVSLNPAFTALRAHVQQQLSQNSHRQSLAPSGKEWVRGWDDAWKQQKAGESVGA